MHRDENGQALVEFILLVPMLVLLVYATWFFSELVRERLRVQQAARYAAFASAKMALTNYGGGTLPLHIPLYQSPTSDFTVANLRVDAEVTRIYGDIVVPIGGTLGGILNTGINTVLTQRMRQAPNTFSEEKTKIDYALTEYPFFPGKTISAIQSQLGQHSEGFAEVMDIVGLIIDWIGTGILNNFGFGGRSMVTASVGVKVTNKLVPLRLIAGSDPSFFKSRNAASEAAIRALASFELRETVTLMGDSWVMGDGRDLKQGGIIVGGAANEESDMHAQVNRLKFLYHAALPGGSDLTAAFDQVVHTAGGLSTALGALTGGDTYGGLFDARVVNVNAKDGNLGTLDVFKQSNVNPAAAGARANYRTADIEKAALDKRGPYFMGCKTAQQGSCDYH